MSIPLRPFLWLVFPPMIPTTDEQRKKKRKKEREKEKKRERKKERKKERNQHKVGEESKLTARRNKCNKMT